MSVCPETGKPIRRVTTDWLLSKQPDRYVTKCQRVIPLQGTRAKAKEAAHRAMLAKAEKYLERHGETGQTELVSIMGFSMTTWAAALARFPSRIKRRRQEGVRGCKHLLYLGA